MSARDEFPDLPTDTHSKTDIPIEPPQHIPELMTTGDVAALFGISRWTPLKWAVEGRLRSYIVGGRGLRIILATDLAKFTRPRIGRQRTKPIPDLTGKKRKQGKRLPTKQGWKGPPEHRFPEIDQ